MLIKHDYTNHWKHVAIEAVKAENGTEIKKQFNGYTTFIRVQIL